MSTLCDPMDHSTPGFPVLHYSLSLLKLMSIESVMRSTILSSVVPFSSCLQSFPASGSFPAIIGTSTSASILPINIQGWFPLGLTGLILHSQRLSSISSHTTVQKHQIFCALPICPMIKYHLTPMAQGIRGLVFPGSGGGLPGMCVGHRRHLYQT